jgi:hypothetical protein
MNFRGFFSNSDHSKFLERIRLWPWYPKKNERDGHASISKEITVLTYSNYCVFAKRAFTLLLNYGYRYIGYFDGNRKVNGLGYDDAT